MQRNYRLEYSKMICTVCTIIFDGETSVEEGLQRTHD